MRTVKITLPQLHQAQIKIKSERRRFNVIDCGRRFGKNVMLQDLAVNTFLAGKPVAWAAPTYKMLLDDWKSISNIIAPANPRKNAQEKQLSLKIDQLGDASIDFWSLDNANSIRGRKYALFIVNEAAFVPDLMDIWNLVVRPTLIDFKGSADFAGTPKGLNGFWQLFTMQGADWMRWQMTSYANPHVPKSELDDAKNTLPQRVYEQEILAQFLEDGAGIFRHVRAAATSESLSQAIPGHQYVIGVDWARSNDATVFKVIDINEQREVASDRMLDTDFASQRLRLKALCERFNNATVLAEQNSIGLPQIEELQRMGVAVQGFLTTNATKAEIVQALELAFERGEIRILNDETTINELMAFTGERLPSGLLRYAAPEGMHDDTVIALALAWWGGVAGASWDWIG